MSRSVVQPFARPVLAVAVAVATALLPSAPAVARTAAASAPETRSAAVPAPARAPVDANTADAAALQAVPGIGPAIAARIVTERARRPFRSLDDFDDRVKGVGEATLRRMVAGGLVVVAPPPTPAARGEVAPAVVRVAGGRPPAVPLGQVITVAAPEGRSGPSRTAPGPVAPAPAPAPAGGGRP